MEAKMGSEDMAVEARTTTAGNLEHFDLLQLLTMLAQNAKSGVLTVQQREEQFEAWLLEGRVRHLQFGKLHGVLALAALLKQSGGQFQFDEGRPCPAPTMNESVDSVALSALGNLPEAPMPFAGPARFTAPERIEAVEWPEADQRVLERIQQQTPMRELWQEARARKLVSRLLRLGLIKERKSRVARLTIAITREVRGVAVVDELILKRWKEDLARQPETLALRDDSGQTYTFVLRGGPGIGTRLLLPPDLIMQTPLRAGESVLAKPL